MTASLKTLAAAAALACVAVAHADPVIDANMEFDTTYTNKVKQSATNPRDSDLGMGGRVEANIGAKGTAEGGGFVAARASLLLKKDGDAAVDDMWVQAGNTAVDAKLGRFEATDLFPVGKDTVLEYAGYEPYRANALRGRFGSDTVHAALGVNAGSAVRVELGMIYSKDVDAVRGFRPAVVFTGGPLTLRAGVESVKVVGSGKAENGFGLSGGFAIAEGSSINVNFAKLKSDKAFGVNGTFGPAGVGLVYGKGEGSADKVTTVYAAYSLPLFGVKDATITPAFSFSKGGTGTENQIAARMRINYKF